MSGDTTPMRAPAPAGQPTRYSKEQIVDHLRGTDPQAVSSSGKGYLDFAASYGQMRTRLRGVADDLAHAWKGPAAAAAQAQLRDLFLDAHEIHTRASQVGTAVKTHGDSYLAWYKNSMPTPETDADAQTWMDYANQRVSETWNALPPELTTKLPPVSNAAGRYGGSSTGGPGSDQSSADDRRGGQGGHGPHGQNGVESRFGSDDQLSLHDRQGRPYDLGSGSDGFDLAGFGGSHGTDFGGGLGGPPGSAPGGVGGSGGLPATSGTGTGGAPTTGGLPTPMPGSTGSGAGAAPLGTGSPAGAEQAAGTRTTGGSGARGPMVSAGGGQGAGERELTRNKWSPEDRETWTGKSQSTASVVGEPSGKTAGKTSRSSQRDKDEEPAEERDGDENELTDEPEKEPAGEPADEFTVEVADESSDDAADSTDEPDAEDPFSELEAEVSLKDLDLPDEWQV